MPEEERTFKAYTPTQAQAYLAGRGEYHDRLYELILRAHESMGGSPRFGNLVDLGCGPGNSTRPLAKHFDHTWGIDPSEGMIEMAKRASEEAGSETRAGGKIVWEVGRAEDVGDVGVGGGEGEVDMIAAGMAAHWFDMAKFWPAASKALRKGGTVALWSRWNLFCHPSTPNASAVQAILDRLEKEELKPFEAEGNRNCRTGWADLTLPWDLSPPVAGFSNHEASFSRIEKNVDGHLGSEQEFFLGDRHVTLEELGRSSGTSSLVLRWREAHPELAGTGEDVVVRAMNDVREVLGREDLVVGTGCVLLLFKKI